MSHNFKPGDLALIVGAIRFPENIGAVVALVAYVPASGLYKSASGICMAEGDSWEVVGDSIVGAYRKRFTSEVVRTPGHAIVDPAHLIPLRGDFAPEQQKAKEAEPCA